jgi:hypothetical protein
MTPSFFRPARLAAALVLASAVALPFAARGIEMGDPNLSPDAAYCRKLSLTFRQAIAGRAADPAIEDARKTGERGAYLCRFDRYREGITMLEQALASLGEVPGR